MRRTASTNVSTCKSLFDLLFTVQHSLNFVGTDVETELILDFIEIRFQNEGFAPVQDSPRSVLVFVAFVGAVVRIVGGFLQFFD